MHHQEGFIQGSIKNGFFPTIWLKLDLEITLEKKIDNKGLLHHLEGFIQGSIKKGFFPTIWLKLNLEITLEKQNW